MTRQGKSLTPSQKLWGEVFGLAGIPELDEKKVLFLVSKLPPREALAVRLRYGFQGRPRTLKEVGERLPRAFSCRMGVCRETARHMLAMARIHLRHYSRRRDWEECRLS